MRPLIFALCSLFSLQLLAQHEVDYSRALADHLGGQTEVTVTSGRVDILTEHRAYEVEWASKWKNSIGQALWYGLQTNRASGIILLLRQPSDYKYFLQLNSALEHGGLGGTISVQVYPNDFPGVEVASTPSVKPVRSVNSPIDKTEYWLSTNSRKRHRKSCRWYEASTGRYCTVSEGVAAGCCH